MSEKYKPKSESILALENSTNKEWVYGPKDLVLVMDTSFLIQLDNRTLWSYNVWFKAKRKASEEGKKFDFFISRPVIDEYSQALEERRPDRYGLPLVSKTLEELLGSLEDRRVRGSTLSYESASKAWVSYVSQRFNQQSNKVRNGANNADLSVTALSREIAGYGADVWVASYDFRDIIGPLKGDVQRISEQGLKITPIAPFKVEQEYFVGTDYANKKGNLFPVLSREVVADLQVAKLHPYAFTYVIIERGVRSGDASLDVVVGVVEFKNLKEVKIPKEYKDGDKELSLIPVVRINSLSRKEDQGIMRSYFRRSDDNLPYRLLVIEKENPLFPILIFPSGSQDGWFTWQNLLQASADFLYHQTDSPYAQKHFRPGHKK